MSHHCPIAVPSVSHTNQPFRRGSSTAACSSSSSSVHLLLSSTTTTTTTPSLPMPSSPIVGCQCSSPCLHGATTFADLAAVFPYFFLEKDGVLHAYHLSAWPAELKRTYETIRKRARRESAAAVATAIPSPPPLLLVHPPSPSRSSIYYLQLADSWKPDDELE